MEQLKRKGTALLVAVVMAVGVSLVPGCAWSVGGKKGGETIVQPTRGQELMDLQKARDSGAITEDEFNAQKAEIMKE